MTFSDHLPPPPRLREMGREAAVEHYLDVRQRAMAMWEELVLDAASDPADLLLARRAYWAADAALIDMEGGMA